MKIFLDAFLASLGKSIGTILFLAGFYFGLRLMGYDILKISEDYAVAAIVFIAAFVGAWLGSE